MRSLIALSVVLVACTSNPPAGGPTYDSVKDRVQSTPTRLLVAPPASTGEVTARRNLGTQGWQEGQLAIGIDNGELIVKADARGLAAIDNFSVNFLPIDIPPGVFQTPAQLQNVRLVLANKPTVTTTWTDNDDATLTANLKLDLYWSIYVNNAATPLGTQHLPEIPVDITLTGAGDHVDATIGLHGQGEVWSWANLIELTNLQLSLSAAAD